MANARHQISITKRVCPKFLWVSFQLTTARQRDDGWGRGAAGQGANQTASQPRRFRSTGWSQTQTAKSQILCRQSRTRGGRSRILGGGSRIPAGRFRTPAALNLSRPVPNTRWRAPTPTRPVLNPSWLAASDSPTAQSLRAWPRATPSAPRRPGTARHPALSSEARGQGAGSTAAPFSVAQAGATRCRARRRDFLESAVLNSPVWPPTHCTVREV